MCVLILEELHLYNFRNYSEATIVPSSKITCFTGKNGSGKTNLLDAIYYLGNTRSYFNTQDTHNIRFEEREFLVRGRFKRSKRQEDISIAFTQGEKKKVTRNKVDYQKLSDHFGLIPVVIISPYDLDLINLGSEERRRFIDMIISQFDHEYLEQLIKYNKALSQRNILLKEYNTGKVTSDMLEIWDEQMIKHGDIIYEKRYLFINRFIPAFQSDFGMISGELEKVNINYISNCTGSTMREQLQAGLEKDKQYQYTTRGIHKDDLEFTIMDRPIRKFGSQGQQKTMLLALRTAQLGYIRNETGITPILLLDDVFDKLDPRRIQNLLELVSNEKEFGQVFITDTDNERMMSVLKNIEGNVKMFQVEKGKVYET